jgi:hypothetical protein
MARYKRTDLREWHDRLARGEVQWDQVPGDVVEALAAMDWAMSGAAKTYLASTGQAMVAAGAPEDVLEALKRYKAAGDNVRYTDLYEEFVGKWGEQAKTMAIEAELPPSLEMTSADAAAFQMDLERRAGFGQLEQQLSELQGLGPAISSERLQDLIRGQVDPMAAGAAANIARTEESMAARGLGRSGAMESYENLIRGQLARERASVTRGETLAAQEANRAAEERVLAQMGGVRSEMAGYRFGSEATVPESGGVVTPGQISFAPQPTFERQVTKVKQPGTYISAPVTPAPTTAIGTRKPAAPSVI